MTDGYRRSGLSLSPWQVPGQGRSARGPDVLIDPEKVGRVILFLERTEARVIVTVGRLEAPLALVAHHEVHVAAARTVGMHRLPIRFAPTAHRIRLLRVRIDPSDNHRPHGIPGIPGRFILRDATYGAVDWVKMHQRQLSG